MAGTVRLYYLGGLRPESNDKDFPVRSMGKVFIIPGAGEYIEVTRNDANHIIQRHRRIVLNDSGEPMGAHPAFTLDPNTAKMASEGRIEFTPDGRAIEKVKYTREELQVMLAELEEGPDKGAEKNSALSKPTVPAARKTSKSSDKEDN